MPEKAPEPGSSVTPNPLIAEEAAQPAGSSSPRGGDEEDAATNGDDEGGRVSIKDVLLDAQAYRGINSMCFTLVMIYVGFKFLGCLTPQMFTKNNVCLLYTSPSPRDKRQSRMPSSA